jgi:hypothetical protein
MEENLEKPKDFFVCNMLIYINPSGFSPGVIIEEKHMSEHTPFSTDSAHFFN